MRGLYSEGLINGGKFRFKIDWASPIVGSKFTVFALFYFIFEGNFPSTSSRGAYIWRGDLTAGFLRHRFWGLIFGEAYTWRGRKKPLVAWKRGLRVLVLKMAS